MSLAHTIPQQVDLGEGYGNFKCGPDEDLIPMIDHANVRHSLPQTSPTS